MVRSGGLYVLFAHLAAEGATDAERHGLTDETIRALFAPTFSLERAEPGQTTVGEMTWASSWYWFRRAE